MTNPPALERVRRDIENGNLGKARDRLHGLILAHPNDLSLRSMLADVYRRLQFPEMAGRYWYLEEHRTAEMEQAVGVFERSVRNDPLELLCRLKFRGEDGQLPEPARARLEVLRRESLRLYGQYPRYGAKSEPKWEPHRQIGGPLGDLVPIGCLVGWGLAVVLMIVGLVTVVRWLF